MNPKTVAQLLEVRASEDADRLYLWCGDDRLTYGETKRRADRLAAGLTEIGVEAGDRVALLCQNRTEMLELYFACATIGAVQVPLNAFLKGEFLRYQLDDAQAGTLVADEAGRRAVLPLLTGLPELRRIVLVDRAEHGEQAAGVTFHAYADLAGSTAAVSEYLADTDDLMSIAYTSGTTGCPRGACSRTATTCAPASRSVTGWSSPPTTGTSPRCPSFTLPLG
jgi:carnitine-CoA ligase